MITRGPVLGRGAGRRLRAGAGVAGAAVLALSFGASAAPRQQLPAPRWDAGDVPVSSERTQFPGAQKALYEPTLAIDPTNPRVMIAAAIDLSTQNRDPDMYSTNRGFRTTDGGRSWLDLGPMRYGRAGVPWDSGDPVMTFDAQGVAYFASLATPPEGGGGIYVHRSTDGGASWGRPVLAVGEECDRETDTQTGTDKEWLTVDSRTRRAYLTYTGLTVSCTSSGVPEGTVDALLRLSDVGIYLSTSSDRAGSWSAPRKIWDGYALGAMPATAPDGTLHVTFWSATQGPTLCPGAVGLVLTSVGGGPAAAVVVGSSRDGGRTWRFQQHQVCGFEAAESTKPGRFVGGSFLPSLAVDGSTGTAYVAFPSYLPVENRFTVQLLRSADGGSTWSEPRQVPTGTGDARMPTLLADRGVLRLTYAETSGLRDQRDETPDGTMAIRYVQSVDAGATWSPAASLTTAVGQPHEMTELGDYMALAASGSRIAAVWTDARTRTYGQIWSRSGNQAR